MGFSLKLSNLNPRYLNRRFTTQDNSFQSYSKENRIRFAQMDPNFKWSSNGVNQAEYSFYIASWLSKKSQYFITSVDDYRKKHTHLAMPIEFYPDENENDYVEVYNTDSLYKVTLMSSSHRLDLVNYWRIIQVNVVDY